MTNPSNESINLLKVLHCSKLFLAFSIFTLIVSCVSYHSYSFREYSGAEIYKKVELKDDIHVSLVRQEITTEISGHAPPEVPAEHLPIHLEEYFEMQHGKGKQSYLLPNIEPSKQMEASLSEKGQSKHEFLRMLIDWVNSHYINSIKEFVGDKQEWLGWNYLAYVFTELLDDLNQAIFQNRLSHVLLHSHQDIFSRVEFFLWPYLPDNVRVIAITYFLRLWNTFPPIPQSYDEFILKVDVAERLKKLFVYYGYIDGPDADLDFYIKILNFYEKAFVFHQIPIPLPPSGTPLPIYIETYLDDYFRWSGVGYAYSPREGVLVPLKLLPFADFEAAKLILLNMGKRGIITPEDTKERVNDINVAKNLLSIKHEQYWMEVFRSQGDKEEVANKQILLSLLYKDLNDFATAERFLENAVELYREIGRHDLWAARIVDLSTYKVHFKRWKEALNLINSVKPLLFETYGFGDVSLLENAYRCEWTALTNLGEEEEAKKIAEEFAAWAESANNQEMILERIVSDAWKSIDPKERKASILSLLKQEDLPPYFIYATRKMLLNVHLELGELEDAELWANRILSDTKKWKGWVGEKENLGILLEINRERGNFGAFFDTLTKYEAAARKTRGENWMEEYSRMLAEVFYHLEEYTRAEEALRAHVERQWQDTLYNPVLSWIGRANADLFLLARIHLGQGKKQEALRNINSIEKEARDLITNQTQPSSKTIKLIKEIAELKAAAGRKKEALDILKILLAKIDIAEELDLWTDIMIRLGELRLELQESPSDIVNRFEEMVPKMIEFQEVGRLNLVRMDLFLGKYYRQNNQCRLARERLERALQFAIKFGDIEHQIIVYRELGEVARSEDNLVSAIDQYRNSIDLLKSVSLKIPKDIAKVGYRKERQKAIPLCVVTLYELYRRTGDTNYLETMLVTVEEGKSRALTEMVIRKENVPEIESFDLSSLRTALTPDTALLEYYIPETSPNQVFRFYVDQEALQVEELKICGAELDQRVQELLKYVKQDINFEQDKFKKKSQELAKVVLLDILFSGKRLSFHRLFIIPSGRLHLLPFSLFVDYNGRYLNQREELDIAYLPNASLLLRSQPSLQEVSRSFAFVNPALDRGHHDYFVAKPALCSAFSEAFERWAHKPVAWEQQLTKDQFLTQLSEWDNVFIYAHARFLLASPMDSYIRFAGSNADRSSLTAADLLTTDVGRGLWTLAGCSTGGGKLHSGGEVLGLPRALLQNGATMVVISLWDVDVSTTLEIMAEFYANLGRGDSCARALRLACEIVRESGENPFGWAPFILEGFHDFRKGR